MGNPGFGIDHLVPGFVRAMITKNMMGLAPGVTTISSGATGMPRVFSMSSARASRSSGRPADGP